MSKEDILRNPFFLTKKINQMLTQIAAPMFQQNQITITQVANGWMVVLPYRQTVLASPFDEEAHIRRQARIMRDEFEEDYFLKDIQDKAAVAELPKFKEIPLKELKEKNISVFKTFAEVMDYLKFEVGE